MTFDLRLLEFPAIQDLLETHAVSALGQTRIRALQPWTEREPLTAAIRLTSEMMPWVERGQEPPLHALRDVTNHLSKVRRQRAFLDPQELLDIKDFLDTAAAMRRYFDDQAENFPSLHALAMPLQPLNALSRAIDEKIAPNSTVRDHASELLARLRADIASVQESIQRELGRLVRSLTDAGDLQDDFFTLRNDRYVLPVRTSNRGKVPGIIHDSSNTGETVFIEPFVILEQSNKLADFRLREREEVFRILLKMADHVRQEINGLLTDLDILGEFDLVLAKARFGVRHKAAFPTLSGDDKPISLHAAHHPLLFAMSPGTSRPLNLGLDTTDRVLVISGPNAGGKTTALKTLGLTAIMVQCAVPAPLDSRSRLPIFHDVLANIGDEQSIAEGQSTFSSHMRRMASIINSSGPGSLVLLDELGTATDPGEGGALAVAILESLARRGAVTVVSSHLTVLKSWAHSNPEARNASFRLSEVDRRPTYRLTLDMVGISEALVVAEQAGLPADVLERARSLRPESEGDATSLLLSLQEKESQLADEVATAERLRYQLEERERELDRLDAELREERRQLKRKLQTEKEQEMAGLRAQVERLIAHQPSKQELTEARTDITNAQQALKSDKERIGDKGKARKSVRPLQVGDAVRVRSLGEDGTVLSLDEARGQAKVAVRRISANVKLADLERLPDKEPAGDPVPAIHYKRPQFANSVLDLHGVRVEEALARTDKFIDQALAAGLSNIKVMHGQGSGALRKALHEYLRTNPEVKNYRYANAEEGGGGVTVVTF